MKKVKICYFSAATIEMPVLCRAVEKVIEVYKMPLEVIARSQHNLTSPEDIEAFVQEVREADWLIISLMGGEKSCPGFDEYVKYAKKLHIQPESSQEEQELSEKYSIDFGSESFMNRLLYLKNGGLDNFCNLLLSLVKDVAPGACTVEIQPPATVLYEGIYHHRACHTFDDTDEYMRWYDNTQGKIVIGIWLYHSVWLNGNLEYADALIKEIEKQNCIPLCVFSRRGKDMYLNNKAADEVAGHFFRKGGKAIIDVLLNPGAMSISMLGKDFHRIQPGLDVPVLQIICTQNPYKVWDETIQAVTPVDVSCSIAQPEFDGNLITVVAATREIDHIDSLTGAVLRKYMPVPERVRKIVNLAKNWAQLRHIGNKDKKVAIVFHHNPPRNDRMGCAVGLDTFQSVKLLIDRLKEEGYSIEKQYESGEALAHEMLTKMTNDSRWLPLQEMAKRSSDLIHPETYRQWSDTISEKARNEQCRHWDKVPGKVLVHEGCYMINGLINSNVYIGLQPPRGHLENSKENLHNPLLPPPHVYPAWYRWIRYVFKADAVIHVGKHGSLEWLPGKSVGLSQHCYPDLSIQDLPNIYPYIINNPGEGAQAKRRSYCCIIDHLTPPFVSADKSEGLAKLDDLLGEYMMIKKRGDTAKIPIIKESIIKQIKAEKLETDLHLDLEKETNVDVIVEKAHSYINEVSDTIINDGLHTLGCFPRKESFVEFLVNMTRLKNGDTPSLRDEVLKLMSYDYLKLCAHRGKFVSKDKTGAQIIEQGHQNALLIVRAIEQQGWQKAALKKIVQHILGKCSGELLKILQYIVNTLRPNVLRTVEEMDAVLNALNGRFVCPGPSGAVTRGRADILPTGRNFYSVDPYKIPTLEAWEIGKKLGDELVERYRNDHNSKYPQTLGIIIWASPAMRTQGDDIAEVLYLMGVRPVWNKHSGRVEDLEIIPKHELKFPRIDVTLRTSGMFRDAFPNVMRLVDEAVKMVVALKESYDTNFLKRNIERETKEFLDKGYSGEESFRMASFRVFSTQPGGYGAGVNKTLDAKQWKDKGDLAEVYVSWGGYAYTKESYGQEVKDVFRKRLGAMDMTLKNEDSREYDMLSGDDFNSFHGGMNAAVTHFSGKQACSYSGSSADPRQVQVRSSAEEAKFVFRVRILNPKWIEGMKRHGYKGAGDLSRQVDICFQWDATSDVVDDWMYQRLAETYTFDEEMQEWFKKHNPYALNNITERLLEAIKRGMWNADEETQKKLQELYLKNEGDIEEILDEGAVVK